MGSFREEENPVIECVRAAATGWIYTAASEAEIHQYKVEGVGEDFWPDTLDRATVDRYLMVRDDESFAAARRMAAEEGLLVGGSGGMAVSAAIRVAEEDHTKLIVVLIPDSGRGYLSKIFNDEWLAAEGFTTQTADPR